MTQAEYGPGEPRREPPQHPGVEPNREAPQDRYPDVEPRYRPTPVRHRAPLSSGLKTVLIVVGAVVIALAFFGIGYGVGHASAGNAASSNQQVGPGQNGKGQFGPGQNQRGFGQNGSGRNDQSNEGTNGQVAPGQGTGGQNTLPGQGTNGQVGPGQGTDGQNTLPTPSAPAGAATGASNTVATS